MKTFLTVVFDDDEKEVLVRGLQGLDNLLEGENARGEATRPVRTFLSRILAEEPLNGRDLITLSVTIDGCLERLKPETTTEAWRKMGAPGGDDAVEGLAATRVAQVRDLEAARDLVQETRKVVFEYPLTKSERKVAEATYDGPH